MSHSRRRLRPVLVACAALLPACTHVVTPPADVVDPVPVYLLDHGRTSSVVLPDDGRLVRYSYGDWDWYALNRTGLFRASGTLLGPTRAGIGRNAFGAGPSVDAVRSAVVVPVEAAWRIDVPAHRSAALAGELDALFARPGVEPLRNPLYALTFVPHPEPYSLGHNSNHMTAAWLRRLGCRVDTRGVWSRWRVERPGAP